jgi:hypothetical protein
VTSLAEPHAALPRTLVADVRDVGKLVLVGAAAGALAGALVGGVGGRVAMLVLRLTSDPIVIGITSDDGFEIGRFTIGDSVGLVAAMAALGTVNGALYATLRGSIPRRLRAPLWVLFAATVGGSQFVHEEGVDFTVLDPSWLAVGAFVLLPGLAALAVVLLVERWLGEPPRSPGVPWLGLAAAIGTVGLLAAAALGVAVVYARRLGVSRPLARAGRVLVPAVLVTGILVSAWSLVAEAGRILG